MCIRDRGVEAQTIKLFKVCTLRHIPIFTFVNKMDREARDPFGASYIEGNISTTNFRSFYDYINDAKTHKTGDEVLSKDLTYTNANLKGVFKTHEHKTLFPGLDYVFVGLEPTETSKMLKDRKSTRLNSSHITRSRMPSSA